jgi:sulfite exporter TauE/SafE
MAGEFNLLLVTAVTIACLHTLAGPDHYIPFIALSKSRSWTLQKTIFWTTVCGVGHVLSSVVLGLAGAAIGYSMNKIGWIESVRGELAGWMILAFGGIYMLYGLIFLRKNRLHKHFEAAGDQIYVYEHRDDETMIQRERHPVTPWVMFLIFVLGPCEPMIPLLFYPAAQDNPVNMGILVLVYTLITLLVMIGLVLLGYFGFDLIRVNKMERKLPLLSGLAIFLCGIGMVFLGW